MLAQRAPILNRKENPESFGRVLGESFGDRLRNSLRRTDFLLLFSLWAAFFGADSTVEECFELVEELG